MSYKVHCFSSLLLYITWLRVKKVVVLMVNMSPYKERACDCEFKFFFNPI